MIRMEDVLAEEKLAARMLLQVHDELIFEVPENEVEKPFRWCGASWRMPPCPPLRFPCRCMSMRAQRITGMRHIDAPCG